MYVCIYICMYVCICARDQDETNSVHHCKLHGR